MNILLLDYIGSNHLTGSLSGILQSCKSHDFNIITKVISSISSDNNDSNVINRSILEDTPVSIFFLFDSDSCIKVNKTVKNLRKSFVNIPIILVMDDCQSSHLIELLKSGADEFITLPLNKNDVLLRLIKLLDYETGNNISNDIKQKLGLKHIVGKNPIFLSEIDKIQIVAKTDSRVLINGETGTGKELFARAIHYLSDRSKKPFIPVNCGAIPVELFENELFGHERGAYTSADSSHQGLVNEAEAGTLFLDEIDALPLISQVKLLRFLQDNEFRKVGSSKNQKADIRILAATNINLLDFIDQGKFRRDLYYRLNIMSFNIPSLRERSDDIPLLVTHFLNKCKVKFDTQVDGLTPEALNKLMIYNWPGNVRELEYIIERSVMMARGKKISEDEIKLPDQIETINGESFKEAKKRLVKQFETNYIKALLIAYHGNISRAARAAGKNRRAFWQLIQKHQIDVERHN